MNIIINATQHNATPAQIEAGVYASTHEAKLREWLTFDVSIPLKSGRCCKGALQNYLFKIKELFVKLR